MINVQTSVHKKNLYTFIFDIQFYQTTFQFSITIFDMPTEDGIPGQIYINDITARMFSLSQWYHC